MIGRHVIEGASVLVPARVAYLMWRKLNLERFREATYQTEMETYTVLTDWKAIYQLYEQTLLTRRDAKRGSETSPPRKLSDDQPMTVNDVAAQADVSDSAVRLAAREQRLTGSKTDKGWVFQRDAVAHWIAMREGRRP